MTDVEKSIVALPALPRVRAHSQFLGLGGLDEQSVAGAALAPGALTVITGAHMTGRTTAALTCAATNIADGQPVVFATYDDPAGVVRALAARGVDDTKLESLARVAKVASVNDVATVMAMVIAAAFAASAGSLRELDRVAPRLLVIDDATMLGVTSDTFSASEARKALMELCADLSSGRFATEVLAQVGTENQRLVAMAQLRTGRFTDALRVGTVLTTRLPAAAADGSVVGGIDSQLAFRSYLVVETLGCDASGEVALRVVKSREGLTAKTAS